MLLMKDHNYKVFEKRPEPLDFDASPETTSIAYVKRVHLDIDDSVQVFTVRVEIFIMAVDP